MLVTMKNREISASSTLLKAIINACEWQSVQLMFWIVSDLPLIFALISLLVDLMQIAIGTVIWRV